MRSFFFFASIPMLAACSSSPGESEPAGQCGPGQEQMDNPVLDGTILDTGLYSSSLVVDETHVYWVSDHRMRRVPIVGGAAESIGPNAIEASFAADAEAIYVASIAEDASAEIVSISKGGAAVQTLATSAIPPVALAVDADSVFWADRSSTYRVAKGGGPITPIAAFPIPGLQAGFAVDEANVYWARVSDSMHGVEGGIYTASKAGGVPSKAATSDTPAGLVASGGSLYWTSYTGSEGVHRLDGDGTDHVLVEWSHTRDLAVDATHVYFTEDGGYVHRVSRAGGGVEPIANATSLQTNVYSLAVGLDAVNVYFVEMVPGEYTTWLFRAPKAVPVEQVCVTGL